MEVLDAFALISRAIDAGTTANGYLVVGDLKPVCEEFLDLVLGRLFPESGEQLRRKSHPDVVYLEPEGRSRTIHINSVRERIVEPMSMTAFSGGWKAGVIVGADRLETAAANALLKSLEEPTPKTVFFLLTDAPDMILPTILSRVQRVDLPLSDGLLESDVRGEIAAIFESRGLGVYERATAAKRLAEILGELKDEAEDEDVPTVRRAFFRTVLHYVRRWMTEGRLPLYQAVRAVEAVEDACRQSERFLPDDSVLAFMMDRMAFPQ